MTDTLFKAPRARKSPRQDDYESPSSSLAGKRPRTAEDFLLFCKFILDYENYEMQRHEELRAKAGSPIGSTGSESTKSETPSSNSGEERKASSDSDSDDDGYNTVTCYCGKPFAGRPMIECSRCLTWIHLSCARIRRTNIPDEFICAKCRDGNTINSSSSISRASSSPAQQPSSPSSHHPSMTGATTTTMTTNSATNQQS